MHYHGAAYCYNCDLEYTRACHECTGEKDEHDGHMIGLYCATCDSFIRVEAANAHFRGEFAENKRKLEELRQEKTAQAHQKVILANEAAVIHGALTA